MSMASSSKKHNSMAPADLPSEIISDILFRLPLKSLVRFKCVSKPWLYMMTESSFPYLLLYRHLNCDPLSYCPHNQSSVFLWYNKTKENEAPGSKLFHFGGGFQEDCFKSAVEVDLPLIKGKYFEIKTACCYGMFCIAIHEQSSENPDSKTLVLWNPSIREHRILPLPIENGICDGVCGLGIDLTNDDFKVVSVCEYKVYIFSVKMNIWRLVGELEQCYSLFNDGIPANGCLYWAVSKNSKFANRILCLNLSNYKFEEVATPFDSSKPTITGFRDERDDDMVELNLQPWGSGVSVFRHSNESFWVLKEENNWRRMMDLPSRIFTNDRSTFRFANRLRPKCITKNGRFLVSVNRRGFMVYDGDGFKYENVAVKGLPRDTMFEKAIVYTETLISPSHIVGMNYIDY